MRDQERRLSSEVYQQSRQLLLHVQHWFRIIQGQWYGWIRSGESGDWRKGWRFVSEKQDVRAGDVSSINVTGKWKITLDQGKILNDTKVGCWNKC